MPMSKVSQKLRYLQVRIGSPFCRGEGCITRKIFMLIGVTPKLLPTENTIITTKSQTGYVII